jgi:hypothetical protein
MGRSYHDKFKEKDASMGVITSLACSPFNLKRRRFIKTCAEKFEENLFGKNKEGIKISIISATLVKPFLSARNKCPGILALSGAYPNKNRFFIILFNKRLKTKSQLLYTLAHEFGHCKQMFSGELSYSSSSPDLVYYRQLPYSTWELGWEERPWELEAEGIAKHLIKQLKQKGDHRQDGLLHLES